MNEKEAINFLYDIKTDVVYQITTEEKEAIDEAMKALEKQIPKKPIGFGECPHCYCSFVTSPNYCPACGQCIDWSGK